MSNDILTVFRVVMFLSVAPSSQLELYTYCSGLPQFSSHLVPEGRMKCTRAEAVATWTRTPIGLDSCFFRILHWASIASFQCSVPYLTSWPRILKERNFSQEFISFFLYLSLCLLLLSLAIIFYGLSLLFFPGFLLYSYYYFSGLHIYFLLPSFFPLYY